MYSGTHTSTIDRDGYRPNVGIVLCNASAKVLWARRARHDGWQFPQGGMEPNETAEEAAFRELYEEIGLRPEHVQLMGRTRSWLRYDVPRLENSLRPRRSRRQFRGQKQLWFLFRLLGDDSDVRLNAAGRLEFDDWRWVDYWVPLERIVAFKRQVYQAALTELACYLSEIDERHPV